ncbi:MAG: inositol monophosphatase [Proteobacteria bacterium]|nr:inositol monophosphatase [Pseudomonadota bacterium]
MNLDIEYLKEVVNKAGKILIEFYKKNITINYKGPRDLVTEADTTVEKFLKENLKKQFPDVPFIGEEEGLKEQFDTCFIVDPLDGTTNFAHHYPAYCVSLGYIESKDIKFGVVYDPLRKEMFWAKKGKGAYLNKHKITVSKQRELKKSLLATGFPYSDLVMPRILNYFNHIIPHCQGIRRGGSAALDLSYTACARFDGFFELGLKPWDVSAGILLVREAGGVVTNLEGNESTPFDGEYVATNGYIHQEILEIIKKSEINFPLFSEYFKKVLNDN